MLAETVASWKDTWLAEGMETGRADGIVAGRAEGIVTGRAEGRMSNLTENIRSLMVNLCMPKEKAMDALNVPEEDRAKISSEL